MSSSILIYGFLGLYFLIKSATFYLLLGKLHAPKLFSLISDTRIFSPSLPSLLLFFIFTKKVLICKMSTYNHYFLNRRGFCFLFTIFAFVVLGFTFIFIIFILFASLGGLGGTFFVFILDMLLYFVFIFSSF